MQCWFLVHYSVDPDSDNNTAFLLLSCPSYYDWRDELCVNPELQESVSWYLGYHTFLEENPDIFNRVVKTMVPWHPWYLKRFQNCRKNRNKYKFRCKNIMQNHYLLWLKQNIKG